MNSLINSEFSRLCFFKFTARQSLSFSQNYFFSSEIQLPNLKLNRAGNILINPRNPRSEKQCIQKIFLWLSLFCVYGNGLEMAECLKQNLRGERPFSPAIRFKRFRIGEKISSSKRDSVIVSFLTFLRLVWMYLLTQLAKCAQNETYVINILLLLIIASIVFCIAQACHKV